MSKRGDLRAELRKARQELEQLKDPLIQKARAMGYATEYIEQLEAENKRLKQELADQAISDLGSTVEVIANLEKENKGKIKSYGYSNGYSAKRALNTKIVHLELRSMELSCISKPKMITKQLWNGWRKRRNRNGCFQLLLAGIDRQKEQSS